LNTFKISSVLSFNVYIPVLCHQLQKEDVLSVWVCKREWEREIIDLWYNCVT